MKRIIDYEISDEYDGISLRDYLILKGASRQVLKEFKFGPSCAYINNEAARLWQSLAAKDRLRIELIETLSSERIPPVNLPLDIIYEDEDILVVNKPYDMPIHPSLNNYENSLANAVAYYYQNKGEAFVYRCINRLDRDTSGLTVIAKNILSAGILYEEQQKDMLKKKYIAIVVGEDLDDVGTIDLPIGRDLTSTITRKIDFEHGDKAVTHYRVISKNNGLSLVNLRLETGRTHQIRVHMSAIGHPLIGDFLYNPDNKEATRQALHAKTLSLVQPITGEHLTFDAPLPDDMAKVISDNNL